MAVNVYLDARLSGEVATHIRKETRSLWKKMDTVWCKKAQTLLHQNVHSAFFVFYTVLFVRLAPSLISGGTLWQPNSCLGHTIYVADIMY